MNDHQLVQRFIRVERESDNINILVCKIGWDGPHTPISTWELVVRLKADVPSPEINAKVHEVLSDKRYFQTCQEYGERNPCGWMYNKSICQGCAERNHGVVY
ncbi:MAG: hypothetical protein WBV73_05825 [Phormidium sp.]